MSPISPEEALDLFAGLFEPLAALALDRGVRLPALIDSLKLALVRAAAAVEAGEDSTPATRSDSRLAVMTGVHRKDLRRIRTTGSIVRPRSLSVVGEVFARWRSDPRFLTRRGESRVLLRQRDPTRPSFEELVATVTRDVHPRPVLDELLRLGMVRTEGRSAGRVRLLHTAYVPAADQAELVRLARDNLADHCAAVAGNLQGGGRRFLEQALYSDHLTEESARQFNRETRAAWDKVFSLLMPRLQELHEADRRSAQPRNHRVRLGMYGFVGREREKT